MIAGADARTCARQTSRHVFYPVFGVPGQDPAALCPMQELLAEYARILAPDAEVSCQNDLTEKQLQASASVRAPVFFIRL